MNKCINPALLPIIGGDRFLRETCSNDCSIADKLKRCRWYRRSTDLSDT